MRVNWYACRASGGQWPQMYGPYGQERAEAEARQLGVVGFVVGFGCGADRGDFLRRYEDAARGGELDAFVGQLRRACGFDPPEPVQLWLGLPGVAEERCDRCGGPLAWGAGACCAHGCESSDSEPEPEPCSSCGAWGCLGTCEQGRDDDPVCTGCPGGCLQCEELNLRDNPTTGPEDCGGGW